MPPPSSPRAEITASPRELSAPVHEETLHLGFGQGRHRAWLFDRNLVVAETQTDEGYDIAVRWSDLDRTRYGAI